MSKTFVEPKKDLKFIRLMLVLASFAPSFLFFSILWTPPIPTRYFWSICALMILIPHFFLLMRIRTAKKEKNYKQFKIMASSNMKDKLLSHLIGLFSPLLTLAIPDTRMWIVVILILLLVIFLSYHLRLYYLNLILVLFGYRFHQISLTDTLGLTKEDEKIIITKRNTLSPETTLYALNLGGSIYYEYNKTNQSRI